MPQIKFYKYTNKNISFFNVYPSRANKNNFPRHKYTKILYYSYVDIEYVPTKKYEFCSCLKNLSVIRWR